MIHDDWNFTLSAFSHSVAAVVVTATGDSYAVSVHVEACFRRGRPKALGPAQPSMTNSSYTAWIFVKHLS